MQVPLPSTTRAHSHLALFHFRFVSLGTRCPARRAAVALAAWDVIVLPSPPTRPRTLVRRRRSRKPCFPPPCPLDQAPSWANRRARLGQGIKPPPLGSFSLAWFARAHAGRMDALVGRRRIAPPRAHPRSRRRAPLRPNVEPSLAQPGVSSPSALIRTACWQSTISPRHRRALATPPHLGGFSWNTYR
jgi:hypothetical protein